MADQPLSINLALIVARVMSHPRGWRVDLLKQELAIADRTYRKYRKILTQEFAPFQRRDGTSSLVEVGDGEFKYLRVVCARPVEPVGSEFSARVGALYLARAAVLTVSNGKIKVAMNDMVDEFGARLTDRKFALSKLLRDIDTQFPLGHVASDDHVLEALVHAAVFRRDVLVSTDVAKYLLRNPRIWWRRGHLIVSGGGHEFRVSQIKRVRGAESL